MTDTSLPPLAPATVVTNASFEELVEHEAQRSPGGSDNPMTLVNPHATVEQRRDARRINQEGDGFAYAMGGVGVLASLMAGPMVAEATGSSALGVVALGAATATCMGGVRQWAKRVSRRKRAFDAAHPRVRLVGPDWAATAHERFTGHAATLARLDVPDEVRASLVETRRVMDDLLVAVCDLYAAGLVDTPDAKRIYAQMRRHGSEVAALVAVARQREVILDGRSAQEVLAASSAHSLLDAAGRMQDENAHLSALLDGSPAAVGGM